MRLSDRFKFVSVSNPRCGSTSVRRMVDPFTDVSSNADPAPSWRNHHASAEQIMAGMRETGRDPNEYTFFTTIRNPWARAWSIYKYGKKNENSAWHSFAVAAGCIDDFLAHPTIDKRLQRFSLDVMLPEDAPGRTVIKLENINTALPALLQILTGESVPVKHVNAAEGEDWRGQIRNRAVIDRIGDIFAADIAAGNYEPEG